VLERNSRSFCLPRCLLSTTLLTPFANVPHSGRFFCITLACYRVFCRHRTPLFSPAIWFALLSAAVRLYLEGLSASGVGPRFGFFTGLDLGLASFGIGVGFGIWVGLGWMWILRGFGFFLSGLDLGLA
jgi:hypothetical protein